MSSSARRRRLWRCVVQQPQQCFAWDTLVELCPAHFGGRTISGSAVVVAGHWGLQRLRAACPMTEAGPRGAPARAA